MTLPEKFVERMLRELGEEEGRALCGALDTEPPVSIRLHPSKGGDTAHLDVGDEVPWCRGGRYLKSRPSFTFDAMFHAGAYYVQEASSQFVGLLAGEVGGLRVLDMCAAPGGKSTLYSSLVGDEGLVVANELDRRRAQVLADNVRKWGLGNVVVTACDAKALGDFEACFDVVAVDAPCSGEGMFRKDEGAREEWSEGNVKLCAQRQDDILCAAWRALKPGGKLIYSTCTFNREEDEGSLERMSAWAGDELVAAETVEIPDTWGIVCGRSGEFQTFRFFPHRCCGEGLFAAVARKSVEAKARQRRPKGRRAVFTQVDKATLAELSKWVTDAPKMQFADVMGTIYGWPKSHFEEVKALSESLPVIYSGVAVGQMFKGRLKPDPALAFYVGLRREALPVADIGEQEALAYLRRQEIAADGLEEGMNLITCKGQALGFAKRIGRRVNNLYPNSLRIIRQ